MFKKIFSAFGLHSKPKTDTTSGMDDDYELIEMSKEIVYVQTPHVVRRRLTIETLEFSDFPVVTKHKIRGGAEFNKKFFDLKEHYVQQAFDAVEQYYYYATLLVKNDKVLSKLIEFMTKRMIEIYWDAPASKLHHDKSDFGLLKHSIRVAVNEAKQVSGTNIYSELGGIDNSNTRKRRDFFTACGYIVGLLHDADKLLQIDMSYRSGQAEVTFNPLRTNGRILDFKMLYPPEHIDLKWTGNRNNGVVMGVQLLNRLMINNPQWMPFCNELSGREYTYIFSVLNNYQSSADHIAVAFAQDQDGYLNEVRVGISRILKSHTKLNATDGYIFKVSPDWYLLIHNRFFGALNQELMTAEDALAKVLAQNGQLFVRPQSGQQIKTTFELTLFIGDYQGKKYGVSFCKAAFIETLPDVVRHQVPAVPNLISRQHSEYLYSVGLHLPETSFTKKPGTESETGDRRRPARRQPPEPPELDFNKTDYPQTRPEQPWNDGGQQSPSGLREHEMVDEQTGEIVSTAELPAAETAHTPDTPAVTKEQPSLIEAPELKTEGQPQVASHTAQPETVAGFINPVQKPTKKKKAAASITEPIPANEEQQAVPEEEAAADGRIEIPEIQPKFAKPVHERYSVAFWNYLPVLQIALLETLANSIGAADVKGLRLSNAHLQRFEDQRTIFYLLPNRSLLARTPNVIKFAWQVLLFQRDQGLYQWLNEITDLPIVFNGEDAASVTLLNYFFRKWKFINVLLPVNNLPVFQIGEQEVNLIAKGLKVSKATISGKFVAFDPISLNAYTSNRLGQKDFLQVMRSYYQNLYHADFD